MPEAYNPPDTANNGTTLRIGSRLEGYSAPETNTHFFERAVLAQTEIGATSSSDDYDEDMQGAMQPEVKVLAHVRGGFRIASA